MPLIFTPSPIKSLSAALLLALLLALSAPFGASAQRAGSVANASGATLEDEVEAVLAAQGFEILASSDWDEAELYRNPNGRWVVTNAPYETIYGRGRIEFLVIDGARQILIETKRQNASGSVDEKLPFVFANAEHNLPEREFVFVMDGDGWRAGAVAWIEARAAETPGFEVLAPDALADWLARPLCDVSAYAPDCIAAPASAAGVSGKAQAG